MDDKKLIMLLKANPQEGLSQAIELYGGSAKWVVKKMMGNCPDGDIEECLSDVFVKLWKNADNYRLDGSCSVKNYICGIARHTAIDYIRKNKRTWEALPLEETDVGVDLDFADEMAKAANIKLLQEEIDSLPEPDRRIFILRYYLQVKVSGIAEALALNPKAVENRLYRGKKALKESLIKRGIAL